jgi:hypothetical protein
MTVVYIHVHIPKNAGTTFNNILRRNFGNGYATTPEPRPGYIMSPAEKRAWLRGHPNTTCVSGHAFRYPAPPEPGRQFRYIAFLREPVARLVSLYAYERQIEAGTNHSSQRSVEEWVEARFLEKNALENYQTMHLLGVGSPEEIDLRQAKRLVDKFFLVGLTEAFDDSLRLLAQRAGLSQTALQYQRENVTNSKEVFPITKTTRQRLLDLNTIDAELYAYAQAKLARDLARLAADPADLPRPGEQPWWRQAAQRLKRRWMR